MFDIENCVPQGSALLRGFRGTTLFRRHGSIIAEGSTRRTPGDLQKQRMRYYTGGADTGLIHVARNTVIGGNFSVSLLAPPAPPDRVIRDCYSLIYKAADGTRFTATRYTMHVQYLARYTGWRERCPVI